MVLKRNVTRVSRTRAQRSYDEFIDEVASTASAMGLSVVRGDALAKAVRSLSNVDDDVSWISRTIQNACAYDDVTRDAMKAVSDADMVFVSKDTLKKIAESPAVDLDELEPSLDESMPHMVDVLGPVFWKAMGEAVSERLAERIANDVSKKLDVAAKQVKEGARQVTSNDADVFWQAVSKVIDRRVSAGEKLTIPEFGTFYLQRHKGHTVQFGGEPMEDYIVFKFSADSAYNHHLRNLDAQGDIIVPSDLATTGNDAR